MSRSRSFRSPASRPPRQAAARARLALAVVVCTLASGCYFGRATRNVDTTPTVDTGVGAAIIMPGQSAPAFGGAGQSGPNGASEGQAGPGAGASAPAPRLTMIGGSSIEKERNEAAKEDPLMLKVLLTPFALIAAPFKATADALQGDPEPGPPVPDQHPQRPEAVRRPAPDDPAARAATAAAGAPPAPGQPAPRSEPLDYETQQLLAMERELDRTGASRPAPAGSASATLAPSGAGVPSIADELAALQRAAAAPRAPRTALAQPAETRAQAPGEPLPAGETAIADGIVDRDEDGRVDLWIYRRDGRIVRKVLDQDFDGRPDTSIHYDADSSEVGRVEEDTNHDGTTDTWTDYEGANVARRRADTDRDGSVDTWSYYREGALARHEQDSDGDGFRDRVSHYEGGRLAREELDRNGDGRPEVVQYFDASEAVVRREEDTDLDGSVDVISHYENGRLARRELLSDAPTATR
jgi:hypothetical protein